MSELRLEKKTDCPSLPLLHPLIFLAAIFAATIVVASEAPGADAAERPRFVSLRSDLANMREGPSTEHGVKWIYQRQGLPLQVLAEYDVWRRVRDMDGEIGWIHVSLLANERTALVIGSGYSPMRADEDSGAPIIAEVEAGVVGNILSCGPTSCHLDVSGVDGWVDRVRIWGVYADERL